MAVYRCTDLGQTRKRDTRKVLFLAVLFFVVRVAWGAKSNIFKIDLRKYGWQAIPDAPHREWPGTNSRHIWIDHQARVLVGFAARNDEPALASRQLPGFSFRILRFDATGSLDASLVLPTNNLFTNGFYLGADDAIFARANDQLQWLVPGNPSSVSNDWHVLLPCSRNCTIGESATRKTFTVSTYSVLFDEPNFNQGTRTNALVDASVSPPKVVSDCTGGTITDKFAYLLSDNVRLDIRRHPLCDGSHVVSLPLGMRGATVVVPLTDDLLLLLGTGKLTDSKRRGVDLIKADGTVVFHRELPEHDRAVALYRTDEAGDRVTFLVDSCRGGSQLLDVSANRVARRIEVLSKQGEELASVPVPLVPAPDFDFCLSPDGHLLAILENGIVTVVSLP